MLDVRDLTAGYGGPAVIDGVQFHLAKGEVLGILGRNGAGKSALVKAVMGLLPRISGDVRFRDRQLMGLPTHRIARAGVGLVPQGRWIFPRLTVRENLMAGCPRGMDPPEAVFTYFPILGQRMRQLGGTMSGGEQQMLAIARALCSRPKVLLLDEPSDGVQPNIVQMLGELIPELCAELSISAVLVEQNLDLVLSAARRCLVLERGRIVHEGAVDGRGDVSVLENFLAV
ncbi:ABC transporter ATP-binding protein [Paracidovorax citrulli]|uniref:Amino acid/amide ABC transporter ATP-binding protein 2, HAAT family n=2 Tax=Paracidovorax citrulli TaxID=80869 RepID=A1TTS4_PARC0|nr:ABC transporter ATP-binding protein [Paracidovorax citrulli]ABM34362.1 amino acid/amide ABC transporter ATP-binding protein 2, HAAT family [Paracidovorax citrulli AAC00-1]ATG93835.1 ABC transporter ATP-binding protein [Paracidovorax citrulli]MVT37189.1 ATP-binding cassette domain-containing protein [Paracidovorax citrulli]PVY63803.1 amino acid/amide ABC transporter ATP-binding protein 2 (HAAT family) [Paracidovorax citrulli]QCX09774.1 High-affinity branched-chain amino acid transport ATP-bi